MQDKSLLFPIKTLNAMTSNAVPVFIQTIKNPLDIERVWAGTLGEWLGGLLSFAIPKIIVITNAHVLH